MVVCGSLWWFAVVCDGLSEFAHNIETIKGESACPSVTVCIRACSIHFELNLAQVPSTTR